MSTHVWQLGTGLANGISREDRETSRPSPVFPCPHLRHGRRVVSRFRPHGAGEAGHRGPLTAGGGEAGVCAGKWRRSGGPDFFQKTTQIRLSPFTPFYPLLPF